MVTGALLPTGVRQTAHMPTICRLWPEPDVSPLDDKALLSAYAVPAGAFLRTNFVTSADGAATVDGKSGRLGGAADKRVFDLLRVQCDAVMVAAGTLRSEGYGVLVVDDYHQDLRRSLGRERQPVLVTVSGKLDLDPAHPIFAEAPVRPWVLTHEEAPRDRRTALSEVAEIVVCGRSSVDLEGGLKALGEAGIEHVLSEGGPSLLGAQLAAGVLDELCLTVAPKLAGSGANRIVTGPQADLRRAELSRVLHSDDGELFLTYRL